MKKNFDMSGIQPKLREILEELDGRIPGCRIKQGAAVKDAAAVEPVIRKKVKGILNYEEANGTGYHPEVASIKEGDGSITWVQTDGNTKESIYGLSSSDKAALRRHRRLRGYD